MEHELNIKFTNKAMKKLGKMESTKKEKFLTKIKNNVYMFIEGEKSGLIQELTFLKKVRGFDSSLYILRLDQNNRAILSIEDDPIFGRMDVIIYALTNPGEYKKEISSIMESLYQKMLNEDYDDKEEN